MKNSCKNSIFLAFTLFLWLFGHIAYAQQLICPSPFAPPGATGQPFSESWNENLSTGTKYIPTVVHLIGDASALTYNQVKSAIDQLNADFVDPMGIRTIVFVLATISDKGNCTDGIIRHPHISYNALDYKDLTTWPNDKYFNIWVMSKPGLIGSVAKKPSSFSVENDMLLRVDLIAGQSLIAGDDGLTIHTTEIYPNNPSGRTLTHETGHWLNLLHVFTPCEAPLTWDPAIWNCCGEGASHGDFIEDTPPQNYFATANPEDCDNTFSTCNNSAVSLDNFMSYGAPCINKFTNGQREWMTHCLDNFRAYIWSEENLRCTGVQSENNPVIATGQNAVWSSSKTITGSLIVEAGATLTIGAGVVVQFCDQGKVVVKQGCRLNLYGTLTSSCTGRMWQGVEVWGTKTQNQWNYLSSQGQFWGYSGAIVEHAKTGVWVNNPADLTGGSTGGLLICTGVSFMNNARSVQFDPYENTQFISNQITSNRGSFTTCLFEVNNDYRGDNLGIYEPNQLIPFRTFIELKGVRGLIFQGCKFQNMRTSGNELTPEIFYGYGIIATEAGFTVTDYCSSPVITPFPSPPCEPQFTVSSWFKNLYTGITAGNSDVNGTKPYSFRVEKVFFEGNWRGVQSTAGSRAVITRNTFKLGYVPPNINEVKEIFGLILDDTHTSFTVEENNFYRDPATLQVVADSWELTGIYCVSIGEYSHQIRKNYFTNLKIGNRSLGVNANQSGDFGLLYLCNENSGNVRFDFFQENGRIRAIQGFTDPFNPGSLTQTAGNLFSHTGPAGSDSDFKNQFPIAYIHGLTTSEDPIFSKPSKLTKFPMDLPRFCESIFCAPPCRTEAEVTTIKQQIDKDAFSRDSLNALLSVGMADPNITDSRKQTRDFLTYRIQVNAAEVTTHLAYSDEGSNAVFRDVLAKSDAYDADLALANDYLGSNEIGSYSAILNTLAVKYQLTGSALEEFNAYRTVTDMLAQHYTNGGNKYTLGELQIEWLKGIADKSPYVRSRGMARRILRIYGYFYPLDYGTNKSEERSTHIALNAMPDLFSLFPNPANQQVQVHIETGEITEETVIVRFIRPDGAIQEERHTNISKNADLLFNVQALSSGIYFIQVRLGSGKIQTKRIAVTH